MLVAFDEAVPGNFLAGVCIDPFVANPGVVFAVDHVQLDVGPRFRGSQRDRNVYQTEGNRSLPDRAGHRASPYLIGWYMTVFDVG